MRRKSFGKHLPLFDHLFSPLFHFPYVSLATLSKFSRNAALLVKMIVQQRFHLVEVTGILMLQTPSIASLDAMLFCLNSFKCEGKITNNQRKIAIFAISFENN